MDDRRPRPWALAESSDPREPAARRDEMAKAAAPYLHARLQPVLGAASDGGPIIPIIRVIIASAADVHPEPALKGPSPEECFRSRPTGIEH